MAWPKIMADRVVCFVVLEERWAICYRPAVPLYTSRESLLDVDRRSMGWNHRPVLLARLAFTVLDAAVKSPTRYNSSVFVAFYPIQPD